jgi:hypothetical protein
VTDQDDKCYSQIDSAIQSGIFPNAKHRLCKWHKKINRNYRIKAKCHCSTPADDEFLDTVENWLYSFCDSVETFEEEEHSKLHFVSFVSNQDSKLSKPLLAFTNKFFNNGFVPILPRLCYRHFFHLPGGDLGASSISESENSALKRDTLGPVPQQSIDRSQEAIQAHEQRRLQNLRTQSLQSLSQQLSQTMSSLVRFSTLGNTIIGILGRIGYCQFRKFLILEF